ncbi:hypothetical protein [Robertkochia solimangrovi]|uniref:hypothetical protein n=1 Tax=Robertkochia solimangrovi TaxID=2213046 RepID=UPI00117ECE1E|nr:hypothetical protein [Robertkochia solimangrovi]TRZ42427.1 hypothetical protein DMZ48_13005 [Robertkochia solimangrovi]
MTTYHLKVMKRNRILGSILVFAIVLPLCAHFSGEIESKLISVVMLIATIGSLMLLFYLFSFGQLQITISDSILVFKWKDKLFFNFKNYDAIHLEDIDGIIVESGMLVKIKTKTNAIELREMQSEFFKVNHKDSLQLLKIFIKETHIKPKDSWDIWLDKGWLTWAYWINLLILILLFGIIIVYLLVIGFTIKLFLLPLIIGQLINFHFKMKVRLT